MPDPCRILITCDLGAAALERFSRQPGFAVDLADIRDTATLTDRVGGYHALIVRSNVDVTAAVLAAGRDLRIVGRAGIGVDNIDVGAATRLGVAVVNAPGGNVVTTAEHALALLMSLARRIPQASASMKAHKWEKKRFLGRELRGKTLGVIGVGRVGSVVAELALGLRLRVLAYDPYLADERAAKLGIEKTSLDRLLETADFLTVHTPLTPETRGLLGAEALARVKPGVLLVNCARGGLVDPEALLAAIESGRVAGAALDVFEVEPPPPCPLHQRDEVILTPHLGASTIEAQAQVAVEVAEAVVSYLTTGVAPNAVNAPAVSPDAYRRLRPHLELAERLGLFLSQATDGPLESVRVTCRGAAEQAPELVTASLLVGLLQRALSERVNAVNAQAAARERGIRVTTSVASDVEDFADQISVEVEGPGGAHVLEGTLFGRREPRLVRFDAYRLDALPSGHLLLIYNEDVPGVIGALGSCLGRHGVNISGLNNGRVEPGGRAISLVNIDGAAPAGVLGDLAALPHVLSVREVCL